MISSVPNSGGDLVGGVARALGGGSLEAEAEIEANVDLVSALAEAAERGEDHAVPTALVLPSGASDNASRWFDALGGRPIPAQTRTLPGVSGAATFPETATAACRKFGTLAVAGVARHF